MATSPSQPTVGGTWRHREQLSDERGPEYGGVVVIGLAYALDADVGFRFRRTDSPLRSCGSRAKSRAALLEHSGLGPPLETFNLLLRPFAVTGHGTVAQALEDRRGVLLDFVVRRQIESPGHGLVVHRTEQRLDVLLEAHPFTSGGHNSHPLGYALASKAFALNVEEQVAGRKPDDATFFSTGLGEHSRYADMCAVSVVQTVIRARRSVLLP
jgi:hypothetical protein